MKIEYKRLPFEQYFIDQSQGAQGGETKPRFKINYELTEYEHDDGDKHKHTIYHKVVWDALRHTIQIYFRETVDKSEWKANFEFASKYYDRFEYNGKMIQLKTATGWGDMYSCIKWKIRNAVSELMRRHNGVDIYVEIIGWSLGSALAQLCAQDLYFNMDIKSHVFTFGSVKPWCHANKTVKKYLSECYEECYNFGDHNDIVSYMVCLPWYFKLNPIKLKQDKFSIFKLFKPQKYHCEYWKADYYKDIK